MAARENHEKTRHDSYSKEPAKGRHGHPTFLESLTH